MYSIRDIANDWSVERIMPIFYEQQFDAPRNWFQYANVAEAFRQAFRNAASSAPDWNPSFAEKDRGIVTCGGGWRFFPSIYVMARAIRHLGCELPIQVWYLDDQNEYDPRMGKVTSHLGVEWVDAQRFARICGIKKRRWGGWELKPFATLHSPFKEVLFLDADCYPLLNPELFFDQPEYRFIGATFWPDIEKLRPKQWEQFGIPYRDEIAVESGQYCIDKSRHYKALWLADWMNDRSDYVYQHIYGDKDTFHLSWRLLNHDYTMPMNRANWVSVGFLNKDFQGNDFLFHRVADKFKWFGFIDGKPVDQRFQSKQRPEHQFVPLIPLERECHEWVKESSEIIRFRDHFSFPSIPDWQAPFVWQSVVQDNEYDLPNSLKDKVIIDAGANYGAFSLACFYRDAKHVVAVEGNTINSKHYQKNLKDRLGRFTLIEKMIWETNKGLELPDNPFHTDFDPWTTSVFSRREGVKRLWPSIHIDEVIDIASEKGEIDLMKIDIEGGEYPALMTSTKLRKVKRVVGEAHDFGFEYRGQKRTIEDVVKALVGRGYSVKHFPTGETNPDWQTHLFFAERT